MSKLVFDISEFQPSGRVQELSELGAEGIILKLGETLSGVPTLDEKFVTFVNDCVDEGIPYGIYYVSHAQDADKFMEEAQWINDTMYNYLSGEFPELGIFWDLEVPSVCRNDVWDDLKDVIGTQQSWYEANKDKIGIYASYSYFTQYMPMDELAYYGVCIWSSQYRYYENSLKVEYPNCNHVGWQYSDSYNGMNQDVNEWYK